MRSTAGLAPCSRIQAATETASSAAASGCDHGSSGSTCRASASSAASIRSALSASAAEKPGGWSPWPVASGSHHEVAPGSATYDGMVSSPSSAARPR